jgi:ribose transport system permease protein
MEPSTNKTKPSRPLLNASAGLPVQRFLRSDHFVLYLSLLYILVLLPFIPRLINPNNLSNVLSNLWPLLAVAIGQTFVLIVAGIDLSQTSIMATVSVVGGLFMATELNPTVMHKSPMWGIMLSEQGGLMADFTLMIPISIAAMLTTGTFIGWLNGLAIARFRMPPFMVTLVSMIFFSAFAVYLTQSENLAIFRDSFVALGHSGLGPLSWAFLITGLLGLTAHLILNRTVLGQWFYALGKNPKASQVSGIPTDRVVILAYVFSGFCAAVAAVLYSARLEAGRPTLGESLLLDIIGATVIGGTSLFGGKGKIIWTVYGVLFFVLLSNSLNLLNLSYFTINIVKGGVILLAALFDVIRTRV